jgi:ribonuclease HI
MRICGSELLDVGRAHQVRWHWVKGHSGHAENDRVDALACAEADAKGALNSAGGYLLAGIVGRD